MKKKKKVLIAHQWTIPHYRLHFYNKVSELKNDDWDFTVIYDKEKTKEKFFIDLDDYEQKFAVINRKAHMVKKQGNAEIVYQNFLLTGFKYDLIVIEHALNNISYPLAVFYKLIFGKKIAYWGTGRDYDVPKPEGFKVRLEKFKLWLAKKADGFFAYTGGVRKYLVEQGVDADKIFVLNNTIDIKKQRAEYLEIKNSGADLKKELGLENCKVLIFVGRMTRNKRIDFLFHAFEELLKLDDSFRLILIGGGAEKLDFYKDMQANPKVLLKGIVPDSEIGKYFAASDMYLFPGAVGLGPLQALSYDLNPVIIDIPTHNSEYEYLNANNSVIFPNGLTEKEYAEEVFNLFKNPETIKNLKQNAWPSISHLTLENMAGNFINGVNKLLKIPK